MGSFLALQALVLCMLCIPVLSHNAPVLRSAELQLDHPSTAGGELAPLNDRSEQLNPNKYKHRTKPGHKVRSSIKTSSGHTTAATSKHTMSTTKPVAKSVVVTTTSKSTSPTKTVTTTSSVKMSSLTSPTKPSRKTTTMTTATAINTTPSSTLINTEATANPIAVNVTSISVQPVMSHDFPDPCILQVGTTWYAFATKTANDTAHIQIASSPNFKNWSMVTYPNGTEMDAIPVLPAWVDHSMPAPWAPSVAQLGPRNFILYYSALKINTNRRFHCVGYATATSVLGPYQPAAKPLYCPLDRGGAIDPSAFQDVDGRRYVVYKVDGNSIGHGGPCGNTVAPIVPTPLKLQQVNEQDGHTPIGKPITLLDNNGLADNGIVEGPALARSSNGTYFLFFSSGCYVGSNYTVSYATATSITGPYTRQPEPLLRTGIDGLNGPGGATVAPDNIHMVFASFIGNGEFIRQLHTATLNLAPNRVANGTVSSSSSISSSKTSSSIHSSTSTNTSTSTKASTSSTSSSSSFVTNASVPSSTTSMMASSTSSGTSASSAAVNSQLSSS